MTMSSSMERRLFATDAHGTERKKSQSTVKGSPGKKWMLNPSPKPRVLHVYGDTTAAKTLTSILRIYHYDAEHVYTAAEALVWCRLNWPDVVIADLTKEPMDGVQFAAQIVRGQPKCKVLLLAEPDSAPAFDSTHESHDFSILSKPVDPQKILDFLASV